MAALSSNKSIFVDRNLRSVAKCWNSNCNGKTFWTHDHEANFVWSPDYAGMAMVSWPYVNYVTYQGEIRSMQYNYRDFTGYSSNTGADYPGPRHRVCEFRCGKCQFAHGVLYSIDTVLHGLLFLVGGD